MKRMKENFVVHKDSEGTFYREPVKGTFPIKLASLKPTYKQQQRSQEVYTKRWKELVEQGAPLRAELPSMLKKRELWNDDMQKQEDDLINKIAKNMEKIKQGKIKLSEASRLMKENIGFKSELILLRLNRNTLDQNTAESMAEQERFNYLVSACTVYDEDGKSFFNSYDDFIRQDEEGSVVTVMAGEALWRLTTNTDDDYRKDWPEYQFLQKYKLVDDKFEFVENKKEEVQELPETPLFGEILDEEGNPISV